MDKIKEKLKVFVDRYIRAEEYGDDDNLFELGYVNSLFAMQLVLFIEKEFDISVNNDDLGTDDFSTINNMCSYINEKINLI